MSHTTINRPANRVQTEMERKQKPMLRMRVSTSCMQQAGIYQGDVLLVEPDVSPSNGAWLVLDFEGRLVVRVLQTTPTHLQLVPLHHHTLPIEWPVYAPLPLVGVVRQVIRKV